MRLSTTSSAPACSSVATGCVVVNPTASIPAALAAWIPTVASSKTADRAGRAPDFAAAIKKTWGSGLPRVMSSSDAIAANRPSSPHSLTLSSRLARGPLEPIASRTPRSDSRIEQRTHAVEQVDTPPRHVAVALFLEIRVTPDLVFAQLFPQQATENAGIRHPECRVDELGCEAQARPPLQLEPRLLVKIKRVHQNAVMIEYGKQRFRVGRHFEVLRCRSDKSIPCGCMHASHCRSSRKNRLPQARNPAPREGGCHHRLYAKNLPDMVIFTRSPLGSASFSTSIVKSIALMIPSPNISWMTSLSGKP